MKKTARELASEAFSEGQRAKWGSSDVTVKGVCDGYVMINPDGEKKTYRADGRDLEIIPTK